MRIAFSIIACALLACCAIQSPQAGPVGFRLQSGFNPRQVSGLILWLDASQITGLSDGDSVTNWFDSSGLSNTATQGTASARPTYKVSVKNGRPAILFDGVDDGFVLTTGLSLSNYTVFVVWAQSDAVDGAVSFIKSGDNYNYHYLSPAYVAHQPGASTITATYATATAAGTWVLTEAYRTGTTLYIGKNGTFDGGQASSINWATDAIGAPYTGGAQFNMVGYIAEMLIYNAGLSTGDRQLVEAYLTSKYAL